MFIFKGARGQFTLSRTRLHVVSVCNLGQYEFMADSSQQGSWLDRTSWSKCCIYIFLFDG